MPYADPVIKKIKQKEYYDKNREKIIRRACEHSKLHYVKKDRSNDTHVRDEFGRFVYQNGAARYKLRQRDGHDILEHRLIYERHYGKIPDGYIVHHINGDKRDNRIENLKAMSITEHNRIHAHPAWNKGKTGYPLNYNYESVKKRLKPVICIETGIEYESVKQAGELTGIAPTAISEVINGHRTKAGGYTFEHIEKNDSRGMLV